VCVCVGGCGSVHLFLFACSGSASFFHWRTATSQCALEEGSVTSVPQQGCSCRVRGIISRKTTGDRGAGARRDDYALKTTSPGPDNAAICFQ